MARRMDNSTVMILHVIFLLSLITLGNTRDDPDAVDIDDNVSTYGEDESESLTITSNTDSDRRNRQFLSSASVDNDAEKRPRSGSKSSESDSEKSKSRASRRSKSSQHRRGHHNSNSRSRTSRYKGHKPTPAPDSKSRSKDDIDHDTTAAPPANTRSRYQDHKVTVDPFSGVSMVTDVPNLAGAGKEELKELVEGLQDQLRESHVVQMATRSVLNVVQEKQQALEDDLSFLKNEISNLHRLQAKDKETVQALKTLVSDNTWGITSLVTSQEQLKKDVTSLKQDAETTNATMVQVEEALIAGAKRDTDLHESTRALQNEVRELKQKRLTDHEDIMNLREAVLNKLQTGENGGSSSQTQHQRRHKHHNTETFPSEPSNNIEISQTLDYSNLDRINSAVEEKHKVFERNMEELSHMENQLRQDMDKFSKKFAAYDTELSRVYAMFYNLSYQMSSLENKMLQHQQTRYEANLSDLQQSLLNFTQHIFNLEQTHVSTRGYLNSSSSQNQQDIDMVNSVMRNHQNRIEILERGFQEEKSSHTWSHDLTKMQLSKLNNSISQFYKSFQHHHIEAQDVFDFIDEKFTEFNDRIKDNDDRLLRVEVRVLNASLTKCEQGSMATEQVQKISDMDKQMDGIKKDVDGHTNLIGRLDHGMTRIFEDFGKHSKIVSGVLDEIEDITELLPQVSLLQQEVNNLISHLPEDCEALPSKDSSGSFLIHPKGSMSSSSTYCEFDRDLAWTVIQRRTDGSVSFAREWEEYKHGFGSPDTEFWIGNENIHYLSTQYAYMLRIEMTDLQDRFWVAEYEEFYMDEEGDNYRLHIDGYRGNATDAFRYSDNMPFSTTDKDNDVSSTHCARFYTSGWWYKHCHYGNLNGRYTVGVVWFNHDFDEWVQLKRTVMKIRRYQRKVKENSTKKDREVENEVNSKQFIDTVFYDEV